MFRSIREPETIYYKPSSDQIVETLQVIMMNHSLMEPIPIEYNTCILHVLEAYHDIRQQLNMKQDTIEELNQADTNNISDFEAQLTRWENKERDYKCEIKKLELLLAKTEGGMEELSLARSNSRIHGSEMASDDIDHSLGFVERSHRTAQSENIAGDHPARLRPVYSTVPRYVNTRSKTSSLTQSKCEDIKHDMGAQGSGELFDPFIAKPHFNTCSSRAGLLNPESSVRLGIDIQDKPLPGIPADSQTNKQRQHSLLQPEATDNLSFSYQPGDDEDLLLQGEAKGVTKRRHLDEHIRDRRHTVHGQKHEDQSEETLQRTKGLPTEPEPNSREFSTPSPILRKTSEPLGRGDSTSSVVTAIRENPGQSSILVSQHGSTQGRPQLSQPGGMGEAITAASHAMAASHRGTTKFE